MAKTQFQDKVRKNLENDFGSSGGEDETAGPIKITTHRQKGDPYESKTRVVPYSDVNSKAGAGRAGGMKRLSEMEPDQKDPGFNPD